MTQAPVPPMANPHLRPHRGTLILVLGILSLVICGFILGIPAWIMGNADLKAMANGEMDPSGEGMTQAGRICGMIAVILNILGVCATIAWFVVVFVIIGASAGAQP